MTDDLHPSPLHPSRAARHRLAEITMATPPSGHTAAEVSAVAASGPQLVPDSDGAAETGPLRIVARPFASIPAPRRPPPTAPVPTTPGPTTPGPTTPGPTRPATARTPIGAPARPAAPDRPRPPQPPRPLRPPRQPPGGDTVLRRLGRATLDLVTGAAAARELVDLAATAQLPVTTGRRIAVVGPRGGAGRTTVAVLLACVYAARRADHTLVVDGDPGVGSLAWRLGVDPDGSDPAAVGPRLLAARGGTLADVEAVLPAAVAGLRVLPGGAQLPPELIRALSRFFAVTVLDGGSSRQADAHAAVLVTPRTPDGVRSTCAALDAWEGGPVVVALVARDRTRHDPDAALRRYGVPVVALPYDRHLAAGAAIRPDRTGAATRRQATRLAGLALTAALGR